MGNARDAVQVGAGRMPQASWFWFEWMSFSGRMRLTGAEEILPPGMGFFGALPCDAERTRVRAALEAAAQRGTKVSLTCQLVGRTGPRTFLLEGEVVRGERALAPRLVGTLVEVSAADPLEGVMRVLAGMLGERGPEEDGRPPSSPRGVRMVPEADA
jgi:hypothetical protein